MRHFRFRLVGFRHTQQSSNKHIPGKTGIGPHCQDAAASSLLDFVVNKLAGGRVLVLMVAVFRMPVFFCTAHNPFTTLAAAQAAP